ncbi:hypothetical protein TNCV_4893671 [Trichonephila clavipes]|nr:hypothetical protein TNCV_4893671 [Trichonephila clavipes]
MAPLVTAPIDTPTIKEIPTPTIVPTQIPNTQTDCLKLITQTLQQTIHSLTTLVQHISLMISPQTVTAQPTPGPAKTTSQSPLTKSQIVAQINNLLNHYDVQLLPRRRKFSWTIHHLDHVTSSAPHQSSRPEPTAKCRTAPSELSRSSITDFYFEL